MEIDQQKLDLEEKGFTIVRNLIDVVEATRYIDLLEQKSGISRTDFAKAHPILSKRGLGANFNHPDGVTQSPEFWSLIANEKLLGILRHIVDPDIKFLQHNDLHVGFSAISWHRDNINRQYGIGPDWNELDSPYKLVRVGLYLQTYEESNFRLGFIPGSHLPPPNGQITFKQRLKEQKLSWLGAATYLSVGMQEWASNAEWIKTEPGDAIIFDPRTLHSGSYINGPKYSIFLAYGRENRHFKNHLSYYRKIRSELGYKPLDPALVEYLNRQGINPQTKELSGSIPDAWTPPALLKSALSRRFKM